ncbi:MULTISPECIES: thermonuclease family protein [unclassified Granulicatella]|uniref:thermonuclease family protein n=1 Tax=unclassified Granulicatella TaxID=2630493 RepID=UPI001073B1B7|nr:MULTISPECIES: thermonuclease family protein [unclassified Granulicatella]MBF0779696.1 thermonuclease family protein [Granulicatella sp. 19428wC4_WM01]TFU96218.1 thermonuclease [Granulicatella sp. WM01]
MKKWIILCLTLFCVACTPQTEQQHVIGEIVSLVKTIDGDTAQFTVDGKIERVRFLLIDTPESVKPNTPVQPYGKEASQRVETLLKQAKTISVSYEKGRERDRYNRLLAYVFVDGELLQDILVKEGLARVAYYKGKEQYLSQLQEHQKQAKAQKIGIWSIDGYVTDKGFKEK